MSSSIKRGDVPTYLIPDILISNNSVGKIFDCVKELCCDEYLYYLKMIPRIYIMSNDNKLLAECAKNNSIESTKYLWEITHKPITIAHLNYQLGVSIFATKQNQIEFEYIDWILSHKKIKLKTENNNREILFDCINKDNLKLFLKIYSHFKFENKCMIDSFTHAIKKNKLLFVEVIYEILIQKNIFDKKYVYKLLGEVKLNYDTFKWIYEKIDLEIQSDDFKKIYMVEPFNDVDLLKFIESKSQMDNKTIDSLLNKFVSSLLFSTTFIDDHDKALESFCYLYYKRERTNEEIQSYFDNACKKYKLTNSKYLIKIIHFLIDEGAEVQDYKHRFYDYYNNKNQIRLKKIRKNYISKELNDKNNNSISL